MLPQAKYSAIQAKSMSDNQLDKAYATAYDAGDVNTYSILRSEILGRLESVSSFISGAFGFTRFPLFNTRSDFKQVEAAQESVKDNAEKVVGDVASKLSTGFYSIAALIVFVGIVVLVVKFKK